MTHVDREWTLWSDHRPPNAPGRHRYRVRANICGMVMQPEWTEEMRLCGMGYSDSEYWPLVSCRWDGYQRYITHKGLEWSPLQEQDPAGIVWGGLNLLPCPFTGTTPTISAQGQYIGAPLWHSEALWIGSSGVPKRRFTNAKDMVVAWNTRFSTTTTNEQLREALLEAIGSELVGVYDCTRVWEAWSVGTMSQNDFVPIDERLDEIVDTVMAVIPHHPIKE